MIPMFLIMLMHRWSVIHHPSPLNPFQPHLGQYGNFAIVYRNSKDKFCNGFNIHLSKNNVIQIWHSFNPNIGMIYICYKEHIQIHSHEYNFLEYFSKFCRLFTPKIWLTGQGICDYCQSVKQSLHYVVRWGGGPGSTNWLRKELMQVFLNYMLAHSCYSVQRQEPTTSIQILLPIRYIEICYQPGKIERAIILPASQHVNHQLLTDLYQLAGLKSINNIV